MHTTKSSIVFWFITLMCIAINLFLFVDYFTQQSFSEIELSIFFRSFSLLPFIAYYVLYE